MGTGRNACRYLAWVRSLSSADSVLLGRFGSLGSFGILGIILLPPEFAARENLAGGRL